MSARILLFGAQGQVGYRLNEILSAAGFEVTALDREQCDFSSATSKQIATMIRAVEPVAVINAAACTAVDKAESEPELAQLLNAEIPAMIAAACAEQQVKLIHFSTDYVFDGVNGAPYAEGAKPGPLSAYGRTKLAGEAPVLAAGGHVFRLQWVFDARGKNFFLTMKKLLAEREEVRVIADQLGAPSNARHIAQAIAKVLPMVVSGALPSGIYHLAAAGDTSWHGFAVAIAEALKSKARAVPIVSAEYPTPAARPKDARLDTSKLASYGIAMPHWREGITEALNP